MLKERDFRHILTAVRDLNQPRSLDEFRDVARRVASQLVECERACFSEIDLQTGRVLMGLLEPVSAQENRQLFPVMTQLLHENPLLQHFTTQPKSATRISDFLSGREWHRTALYNEVYRHIDTEEQMLIGVELRGSVVACVTIHRTRRTFTKRDCLLLEALRPHLMQAYANAVAWSKIEDELDSHGAAWNSLRSGMMIVSPQGRLVFYNAAGAALLQRYFGTRRRQNALPSELAAWLRAQSETSLQPMPPLRRKHENRTLVARLMANSRADNESDVLVLLEEEMEQSPSEVLKPLGLTPRQSEVLLLMMRGQTNQQIAAQLVLSRFTVKRHVEAIYDKLQVSTRNAAAQRAHQMLAMHNNSAQGVAATALSPLSHLREDRTNSP